MKTPEASDDVESMRAFAMNQAAEAAELRVKVRRLERDNDRLLRRLNRIYESWTWRTGRVVLFPYHFIVWLRGKLRAERGG
jgi:hypothetical protein